MIPITLVNVVDLCIPACFIIACRFATVNNIDLLQGGVKLRLRVLTSSNGGRQQRATQLIDLKGVYYEY